MSKRFVPCSIGLCSLLMMLAAGCGQGSGLAKIRVMHAAPAEPPMNILLDNTIIGSNIPYSSATGYINVNSGSHTLETEPVNSDAPILDTTISLASSTNTTVIIAGTSTLDAMVLLDGTQTPSSGTALIRLVNAAFDMHSVDVYVVPHGAGIAGATPVVAGLGFELVSSYQSLPVPTGTTSEYDVYFNEPGTPLTLFATGAISFTSGEALTVVSLDGLQGQGFTFQTLTDLK
jgi:hypothetical protein